MSEQKDPQLYPDSNTKIDLQERLFNIAWKYERMGCRCVLLHFNYAGATRTKQKAVVSLYSDNHHHHNTIPTILNSGSR